jgi:hypothetical protein
MPHNHNHNHYQSTNLITTQLQSHASIKCAFCQTKEIAYLVDCISSSFFYSPNFYSNNSVEMLDYVEEPLFYDQEKRDDASLQAFVFSSNNTRNILTTRSCIASATHVPPASTSIPSPSHPSSTYPSTSTKRRRSSLGFSYAVSEVWCASCQANLGRAIEIEGKAASTILFQKSKVC